MLNVDYKVLEDATRSVNAATTLTAGVPVSINSSGEVLLAADGVCVYGLSKVDKNAYRDETSGLPAGIYGGGKASVVVTGIVTVSPSTYTTSTGADATINVYNTALSYWIFQPLYANAGLISNVNSGSLKKIGCVLIPPTATNTSMQLIIDSSKLM